MPLSVCLYVSLPVCSCQYASGQYVNMSIGQLSVFLKNVSWEFFEIYMKLMGLKGKKDRDEFLSKILIFGLCQNLIH